MVSLYGFIAKTFNYLICFVDYRNPVIEIRIVILINKCYSVQNLETEAASSQVSYRQEIGK